MKMKELEVVIGDFPSLPDGYHWKIWQNNPDIATAVLYKDDKRQLLLNGGDDRFIVRRSAEVGIDVPLYSAIHLREFPSCADAAHVITMMLFLGEIP